MNCLFFSELIVHYLTKWFNKKLNHLNIVLKHNENAKKLELKEDPFYFLF